MAERKQCSNPGCEKKFTAKHGMSRYCSQLCSNKAKWKRAKERERLKAIDKLDINETTLNRC